MVADDDGVLPTVAALSCIWRARWHVFADGRRLRA